MLPRSYFINGVSPNSSNEEMHLGVVRGMHLIFMGSPPAAPSLPTETLRTQIDGVDTFPERRAFARTVLLFECELRQPRPDVSWHTLRRGALVPPACMKQNLTLLERTERRFYNEYCEPDVDFEPVWEAESVRLQRRTEAYENSRRMVFTSGCLLGASVGGGGLMLYTTSLISGSPANALIVAYVIACLLNLAVFLHHRVKSTRLS